MITVKNVSKRFADFEALKNVSFSMAPGETLVLLGTSGSGKTTLLRLINGLLRPDAGEIFIDQKNIADQQPELLRRSIGYVLQGYGLFPHYTVAENIAIVPTLLGWSKEEIKKRVATLLQKLQLPASQYANAYPAELSGGQKQRVGLARALAADPPVLLMDEPFGALDPLTRTEIIKEFRSLDELRKKTIVLVTHDVAEAMTLGDRILLLHKGEIVQLGEPTAFVNAPASEFVQQFFSQDGFKSLLRSAAVIHYWDQFSGTSTSTVADFDAGSSMWELLEWLLKNNRPANVYHPGEKSYKQIHLTNLQEALKEKTLVNG